MCLTTVELVLSWSTHSFCATLGGLPQRCVVLMDKTQRTNLLCKLERTIWKGSMVATTSSVVRRRTLRVLTDDL